MSHDLVRHKELSHQVNKTCRSEFTSASPALSSVSTFTKIEAQGISVDRLVHLLGAVI